MRLVFIGVIVVLWTGLSSGQSLAKIKKAAAAAYKAADYEEALKLYKAAQKKRPKDLNLKYQTALCFYAKNDLNNAIPYFEFYLKGGNPDPEAYYYTARSFHLVNKFEKAAFYYKRYLKILPSPDNRRKEFKRLILQCINGMQLVVLDKKAIVATLGDQINTRADESGITFNPRTPNALYFSSNQKGTVGGRTNEKGEKDLVAGSYKSDLFKATLDQGRWTKGKPLSKRYNTDLDENIIAFPDGGYQILFSRGLGEKEQVLIDNFDEDTVSIAVPFASTTFKYKGYWEGDHFFFTDSILLFSSSRPGGYGGKDIYYSLQMSNGNWTPAQNLGPQINTPEDEVSPFLAKDGRTLYFSSNKEEGMGGFDIYKTVFDDKTRLWSAGENMLPPINSAGDDFDFHLAKDGLSAYFSSERAECIGGQDLFSAYFRTYLPEQMMRSQPRSFTDVLLVVSESIVDNRPDKNINKVTTTKDSSANNTTKEIRETFNLAPIYYEHTTGDIVGGQNIIKSLTKLLTKYPNTRLLLTAHADNTGQKVNDLFLTVKQAEALAKDLIRKGAKSENIWVQGCGQNYPIATNQNFDGSPNTIGHKMNRRINLKVFNIQDEPIAVNIVEPTVSAVMSKPEAAQYAQRIEGLIYRVEITEAATMLSSSVLQDFAHTLTEKRPDDINVKYLVGMEKDFAAAKALYQNMVSKGFRGAKVVPYINGIRVAPTEAQTLFKVYPDLGNYLDFISDK